MMKDELIEKINELRKKTGLPPIAKEELMKKNEEELYRLLNMYTDILKEEHKDWKKYTLIFSVVIVIIIGVSAFIIISKTPVVKREASMNQSGGNQILVPTLKKGIYDRYSYRSPEGLYIVSFLNNEEKPSKLLKIYLDDNITNFNIVYGDNPLKPKKITYFKLSYSCDGKKHQMLAVFDTANITSVLDPC